MIFKEAVDCRKRRELYWTGIIIHHTGTTDADKPGKFNALVNWLTKKDKYYVSAHYLIGRKGESAQLVDPKKYEAFHAGRSRYWHPYHRRVCSDWNRYSVGIELLGDGNDTQYTDEQYRTLAILVKSLLKQFPEIHPLCIVGHENIAPDRKVDPGKTFDWHRFFKDIYG